MNEEKLRQELCRAVYRMKQSHVMRVVKNISPQEYMLLEAVYDMCRKGEAENGINVSILARNLMQKMPAVSRSLKRMEQEGYLIRTVSQTDRRNTYVTLSETGNRERLLARERMHRLTVNVFKHMGEENMVEFIRLMNIFADAIEIETDRVDSDMKEGI